MPQFQVPNPLDLMFLAIDRAARRLGLVGRFIHVHLELDGNVDVAGLKRAVAALHRVYPVTASRLEFSPVLGRPRWRLEVDPPDLDRVVRVHHLSPATHEELGRRVDKLIATQTDPRSSPPVEVHVFRGRDSGDLVAVRWPHALMDGRGGCLITEEIQRLYEENPNPPALRTANDERRECLGELTGGRRPAMRFSFLRRSIGSDRRPETRDVQLPACPDYRELGPVRSVIRRLSTDQVHQAREVCQHVCPGVRFGAFLRAGAIRALHRVMPQPPPARGCYSVPYLIEGRPRPCRTPVCRNLFSLERFRVPTELAPDRGAVAKLLHERTAKMLAAGPMTHYLTTALRLSRLPTAVLAELVRHSLICKPAPWQRGELADPPSLPLGFMRVFADGMPTFCGAKLRRAHVLRPPFPRTGLAVQVTAEEGRLTLHGLCYECRLDMMHTFLDELLAALLEPD